MHRPGTEIRVRTFGTVWIQCCPLQSLCGTLSLCSESASTISHSKHWGSHWRMLVLKVASKWISFIFFFF